VDEILFMGDLADAAFREHYGRVYGFVRSRTASDADAEDIAQTVFVEAAERLHAFKPGSTPVLAWLFTVAHRRLIDAARQHSRRGPMSSLDTVDAAAPDVEYGSEVASILREALASLPRSQRRVVLLRLIDGRSFGEIAERTGSTDAACKMRFARGVAAVRAYLEREGITP
jgi:RNA polymerase sigma-70 factor (ECF subfamily)